MYLFRNYPDVFQLFHTPIPNQIKIYIPRNWDESPLHKVRPETSKK